MNTSQPNAGGILPLSGALDISVAESLQKTLIEWLDREPSLRLDLSAVEGCDTAGLQLLHAAKRSAIERNRPFEVIGVPASLQAVALTLGMPLEKLSEAKQ